jgi:2-polyprenyl-6-methoxyphenol hydroxylase-like FAD-dependent oxidoreductase
MYIGKRAVIIGAGIGGLTAAQALVGHFEKIVVLERDVLPAGIEPRAGVPQDRHPHALLPGGLAALDDLFNGYTEAMLAAGAKMDDWGVRSIYEFPGQPAMPERVLGIGLLKASRPLIEGTLRRHVMQQTEIEVLDGRRVTEIVPTPDGTAVSAVSCEARDGTLENYEADLVIDASSRGELTLAFLRATGREAPEETTIGIDFHYSTAVVEFTGSGAPDVQSMLTLPKAPDSSRVGHVLAREDHGLFVALGGRGNEAPPAEWDDFVAFAARLQTPTLHDALKHARPRGKVIRFAFPESRRRHFERCVKWPHGLVPFADAICLFNPVYGQGMTAAAKEAVILRDLLETRRQTALPLFGLFEALMEKVAPVLDNIWMLAALPDLVYPEVRGERPENIDEALQFNVAIHRAAYLDADIHQRLYSVLGLLKPASELQSEEVVEKVKRLAEQFESTHKHTSPQA